MTPEHTGRTAHRSDVHLLANTAPTAQHLVLGYLVTGLRYFDYLPHPMHPTAREMTPTVRAAVHRVLDYLGRSFPRTNVGIRTLLSGFLLLRSTVRLYKRRDRAGNPGGWVLTKPLILSFQRSYPLSKLLIELPLLLKQVDKLFTGKGIKVWHILLFA